MALDGGNLEVCPSMITLNNIGTDNWHPWLQSGAISTLPETAVNASHLLPSICLLDSV